MKTISFKNPVKINCNQYGEVINSITGNSAGYAWTLVECEAVLFEQNYLNGHKFFIAKIQGGYRLIEYSTGITIGGSYPDKTANKAAAWFKERIDQKGTHKIVQAIQETLAARGRANGIEKQFMVDGKTISYSNLTEIGALPGEIFDLDTIPAPYTYYLENGLTVKRIL